MKFRRPSLLPWFRIAGVFAILFGVRKWGEYSLNSKPPVIDASQLVTVDPVCKMKVPATNSTPHAGYQGKTYYFCSDHCQVAFAKNPAKYAEQ